MTATELSRMQGASIVIYDARTGASYPAKVLAAKEAYGRLRICLEGDISEQWFEPSRTELGSVQVQNT